MRRFIAPLVILLIAACSTRSSDSRIVRENGFIIASDSEQLTFVPVKSMNFSGCLDDLATENLLTGFAFRASSCPNFSYVKRTFESIAEDSNEITNQNHVLAKITAVSIEYSIVEGQEKNPKLKSRSGFDIEGRVVRFDYDIFPVQIISVKPLFCLSKKSSEIAECECKHRDEDDYLYKICEHIKSKDRYSDLPCNYEIKNIKADSIDQNPVVRVELTCCYRGDVAFFDKDTKKLLKISYGAK